MVAESSDGGVGSSSLDAVGICSVFELAWMVKILRATSVGSDSIVTTGVSSGGVVPGGVD